MNKNIKKRLVRTLIFSVIALVIGGGVAWWQLSTQSARVISSSSRETGERPTQIAGLKIGGAFTLTDHNGEKVTERSYEGRYKLIYFGFTYCPAVCPTELQKMRQALKGLPAELAEKVQPVFITTDPERDSVAVMKDYVSLFDPRLVGLTGTLPQVNHIKKAFRIFAVKVQDEDAQDYTMDHSSFTYLMSPENELVAMYRVKDTADFMARDIEKYLTE